MKVDSLEEANELVVELCVELAEAKRRVLLVQSSREVDREFSRDEYREVHSRFDELIASRKTWHRRACEAQSAKRKFRKEAAEMWEAREIMEGVLLQAGYTCMGAYEDVEAFLGVEWSKDKQAFVYPNGKVIE
jgi:hypothetical protein